MILRFALNTLTVIWYGSVVAIIYLGWMIRDQRYLIADSGIGYWLGIMGGSMMILLLIYPARKRKPRWRFMGSIKFWFRFHMFLGIAGPVLIILHSGYQLGSLNGSVAFFSMLIVASSGLVGRYLYRRIHHGLYGEKIRFEELFHNDEDWEKQLNNLEESQTKTVNELQNIELKLTNRHTGMNRSLSYFVSLRRSLKGLRKKVKKTFKASDEGKKLIGRIIILRSICKLGINEILFSYWHILHLPLFIILVISGITHVVVVHFY